MPKTKYYTVEQLIKDLQKSDPKRMVILSSDPEGNSFSPLASSVYDNCSFDEKSCEWGVEELTPELKKIGYTEEDIIKGKKAIVLYPLN